MDGGSLEKERYYHNQGATITTRTLLSQPEGDYYNPGCDSSVLSGCANCVLVVLVNYQLCYKYLSPRGAASTTGTRLLQPERDCHNQEK